MREQRLFPDPHALVDPGWERERRGKIADYLRQGRVETVYAGHSQCRFEDCGFPTRDMLGTRDFTDGEWLWPEGLWHYVQEHHVRLPAEFVAHMETSGFAVPVGAGGSVDGVLDSDWWCRWAAENTNPPPPSKDACSLDEALAICADESTDDWHALITSELGRWKLRLETQDWHIEDFTGPLTVEMLRDHIISIRELLSRAGVVKGLPRTARR
jgi:hypothetical protein